jgi:putative membrane protein
MADRLEISTDTTLEAPPIREDDPRVLLAAERTLLAWIRSGLSMMGFGFLVAKFGLFLREIILLQGNEPAETPRWSVWIGAAMVVLGAIVNFAAGIEHWRFLRYHKSVSTRVRAGYRRAVVSALVLSGVGAVMVVYLLLL